MKHEFHAEYNLQARYRHVQQAAIDFLAGNAVHPPTEWAELEDVRDMDARRLLLAQTQVPPAPYKDYARVGTRRETGGLLQAIRSGVWQRHLQERRKQMQQLGLLETELDLGMFPLFSSVVRFTFRLDSPYVSRDDAAWDVWDNPIKREWVFKLPYVAPSQWKGALRAAMMQELVASLVGGKVGEAEFVQERLQLYRLFGSEKDGAADFLNRAWARHRVGPPPKDREEGEKWEKQYCQILGKVAKEFEQTLRENKYRVGDIEGFQGRLHFYPTCFDQIGLEVINPHPRDTGAGKQPIYFECVPQGAEGTFTLLYVPLDGADAGAALADLEAIVGGVQAMMTQYGFGAKTSSGYGVAEVGKGQFQIAMVDPKSPGRPETEDTQPEEQTISEAVEAFVQRFGLSKFPRWTNEELRASGWGRKRQSEYKRLRKRHSEWDEAARVWRAESITGEPLPETPESPTPQITSREFGSLKELKSEVVRLFQISEQEGGAR